MRILITNDDGIEAPGIEALAGRAVRAGLDVSVLAPRRQMSGTGASMGALALHEPIRVHRWRMPSLDGVPAFAAEATPAACVILSCLGAAGAPPDLVLSGVNAGLNVGSSALHSGTVGAALAAAAWGAKGLAVSTSTADGEASWDTAAAVAVELAAWFAEDCAAGCLNVNVPNRPRGEMAGVRWATLAPMGAIRSYITGVTETPDSDGFEVLTDHRRTDPAAAPEGSDRNLVARGYVTLTGLSGLAEQSPSGAGAASQGSCDEQRLGGLLRLGPVPAPVSAVEGPPAPRATAERAQ